MRPAVRCAALAALVLAGSCADGGAPPRRERPGNGLVAEVASYELLAGRENRFIVGLLTADNLFVSGGSVSMRFSFLGDQGASPELFREATGTFLPITESGAGPAAPRPSAGPASGGRGVYAVEPIEFDRPGFWEVEVEAGLGPGDVRTASAAFSVQAEPRVPAPGHPAPRTRNLTLESKDAPPAAIDSRAGAGEGIPDTDLHRTTIAEAIAAGRPTVAVFSTPVYCVSRFCGPVTDVVAALEREYRDRAAFVHIEIWRDFQGKVLNRAAAEWLLRDEDLTEPWVFLIGGDGRIVARWDNVATRGEIEPRLLKLLAE